jgi:serine/threonine-protein kinase
MGDAPESQYRYSRGAVLRGKYRVERTLGEGGMGIVLLATHLKLEQRVALKVLSASVEQRAHVHARFAREARAAAKLRSEHVVRVLDVDETEDGTPFLVMEFLTGLDLDAMLRRDGPMDAARAADYVLQACEGLAEAHALGIVHRDLKPANLFIAQAEEGLEVLKVLDFGIAKAIESEDELSLTATSGVVGSPFYMSPEQLKGAPAVDARTDIWSLGVVLYQLVAGRLPFAATNATSLAALIASEPPTPLLSVRPDIPSAFIEAVDRCLRKSAAERFPSVVELARALAELAPGANGAADRVSRVSRVAAARKLSLAATRPEEGEDCASIGSAPSAGAAQSARVTAELTDAPLAGQRTEYGSEVVQKPSAPPPKESRRGRMLASFGLAAAVAVGWAVRARMHDPPVTVAPIPSSA